MAQITLKVLTMQVLDIIKEHEDEIKKRYSVRKIGVFGSYIRNDQTESSDLDILVEFDNPTLHNFMGLVFYLEDLFQKKIDLVTTNALSPYMRPSVEEEVVWCE
jgi:predicted nucleotidyltransferase